MNEKSELNKILAYLCIGLGVALIIVLIIFFVLMSSRKKGVGVPSGEPPAKVVSKVFD